MHWKGAPTSCFKASTAFQASQGKSCPMSSSLLSFQLSSVPYPLYLTDIRRVWSSNLLIRCLDWERNTVFNCGASSTFQGNEPPYPILLCWWSQSLHNSHLDLDDSGSFARSLCKRNEALFYILLQCNGILKLCHKLHSCLWGFAHTSCFLNGWLTRHH